MTPATIIDKTRALQAHLDKVAEDVAAGREERAQRGLALLQRQTVLLLRLIELQISGAAGDPRHSRRR